jgi:CheY-like chemotaxis protein
MRVAWPAGKSQHGRRGPRRVQARGRTYRRGLQSLLGALKCLPMAAIQPQLPRILIIDDETGTRELLSEFLSAEGFATVQARDGIDALSVIYATLPRVVLVDLMMPYMSGLELIQQMRNDPPLRSVPIVAMSAAVSLLVDAKSAGVEHVVPKPIQLGELSRILRPYRYPGEALSTRS